MIGRHFVNFQVVFDMLPENIRDFDFCTIDSPHCRAPWCFGLFFIFKKIERTSDGGEMLLAYMQIHHR